MLEAETALQTTSEEMKKWNPSPANHARPLLAELESEDETEGLELFEWAPSSDGDSSLQDMQVPSHLGGKEEKQLKELLERNNELFKPTPGRTAVVIPFMLKMLYLFVKTVSNSILQAQGC